MDSNRPSVRAFLALVRHTSSRTCRLYHDAKARVPEDRPVMTPARLGSHPVPARPVPFTIDRAASMPSLLANRPPSFRTSSRGPTIPRTPVCAPAAFAPPTALVTGGRLLPPAAAPTSMCIPLSRFARGGVGLAETTTSGSRAAPRLRPPSRPAGAGITARGPRRGRDHRARAPPVPRARGPRRPPRPVPPGAGCGGRCARTAGT